MRFAQVDKKYLSELHEQRSEPMAQLYNPFVALNPEELWLRFEQSASELSRDSATDVRQMVLLGDELLGTVSLKDINLMMMTAEIGYVIGEKFYGQGLGTQMVSLFLSEVFQKTDLRRIEAIINTENLASCRLVEKLGFQREGHLRESYILNGKPADNYIYGLLKSEFKPAFD